MSVPAIECFVPGPPRTKGSMKIVNNRRGVLAEAVAGSTRWRQLVAYAMLAERRPYVALSSQSLPWSGPIVVRIEFRLPVEAIAVRSGDLDKLTRNVLDALSACTDKCPVDCRNHAGIYRDDVQVVHLDIRKVGPVTDVGALIRVVPVSGATG